MKLFGPVRLALEDRLVVDAALDEAFAPLRHRTTTIGAARVRAAARWTRPTPTPLRGLALLARIGELSMAAAISAFLFGASLAAVSSAPGLPETSRDAVAAGEWVLNGRIALQRPIDSRATDYRTIAGDMAANAATVRRDASRTDRARDTRDMPEQPSSDQ